MVILKWTKCRRAVRKTETSETHRHQYGRLSACYKYSGSVKEGITLFQWFQTLLKCQINRYIEVSYPGPQIWGSSILCLPEELWYDTFGDIVTFIYVPTDIINGRKLAWVQAKSLQSCLTLCDPVDYSPPGSSVLEILQARIRGLPCPLPGDLPDPGIKSALLHLLPWRADSLPLTPGKPHLLGTKTVLGFLSLVCFSSFPAFINVHSNGERKFKQKWINKRKTNHMVGTSLVGRRLRLLLPGQGAQVQSLVGD